MNGTDYIIFSDGSGYQDGYGGWAVTVLHGDRNVKYSRMGALVGITVDRAELTAMLEGLQIIFEIHPVSNKPKDEQLQRKQSVHIFSDRENLVLSIKGVYERRSSGDLWARFAWYEERINITAEHVSRETVSKEFQEVDLHASTGRLIALAASVDEYALVQGLASKVE